MARFRIESAHEVLRDPGGHQHHWTILAGVLEDGEVRIGDALAIPRTGGGSWLGQVVGFERFQQVLGDRIDPSIAGTEVQKVSSKCLRKWALRTSSSRSTSQRSIGQ